jgi:hypothetical protein
VTILFAGGEDLDFLPIGGAYGLSGSSGFYINSSFTASYRSGYARHSLSNVNAGVNTNFLRAVFAATTSFWVSARVQCATNQAPSGNAWIMTLNDSNNIRRLRLRNTTGSPVGPYALEKVDASGAATQLGSNSIAGLSSTPSVPDKIDIFVNYAVAGSAAVYFNGVQVISFTGDVTTNSVTSLAQLDLGTWGTGNSSITTNWSEVIVSTTDTRNMSLVTQAPSANGNTVAFSSGAPSHVNATLAQDGNPDYSATAGQLQEYQVGQAIPSGTFSVVSVVQHVRATIGSTGPQHIDFATRVGTTDYFSTDQTVSTAWGLVSYNWDNNPATSAPWSTADLAASSTAFNMGYRSAA